MAAQPSERPQDQPERSGAGDHEPDGGQPPNGESDSETGAGAESPGRSLIEDDDEIVEPNEPA